MMNEMEGGVGTEGPFCFWSEIRIHREKQKHSLQNYVQLLSNCKAKAPGLLHPYSYYSKKGSCTPCTRSSSVVLREKASLLKFKTKTIWTPF